MRISNDDDDDDGGDDDDEDEDEDGGEDEDEDADADADEDADEDEDEDEEGEGEDEDENEDDDPLPAGNFLSGGAREGIALGLARGGGGGTGGGGGKGSNWKVSGFPMVLEQLQLAQLVFVISCVAVVFTARAKERCRVLDRRRGRAIFCNCCQPVALFTWQGGQGHQVLPTSEKQVNFFAWDVRKVSLLEAERHGSFQEDHETCFRSMLRATPTSILAALRRQWFFCRQIHTVTSQSALAASFSPGNKQGCRSQKVKFYSTTGSSGLMRFVMAG